MANVLSAILGGDKDGKFKSYLDAIDVDRKLDDVFNEAIKKGLPIEDK